MLAKAGGESTPLFSPGQETCHQLTRPKERERGNQVKDGGRGRRCMLPHP